jgi:EAL domain-containing protein (putative c-di-GMP-specific phosphodiesterase class I)
LFLTDVTSPRSRILLRTLITMCTDLGLDQIAEGVEDTTTRDVLTEVGCRNGPGFLDAKAMPIDEAISWDHENRSAVGGRSAGIDE